MGEPGPRFSSACSRAELAVVPWATMCGSCALPDQSSVLAHAALLGNDHWLRTSAPILPFSCWVVSKRHDGLLSRLSCRGYTTCHEKGENGAGYSNAEIGSTLRCEPGVKTDWGVCRNHLLLRPREDNSLEEHAEENLWSSTPALEHPAEETPLWRKIIDEGRLDGTAVRTVCRIGCA